MWTKWLAAVKAACIGCGQGEGDPRNGGLCSSCAPFTNPRPRA